MANKPIISIDVDDRQFAAFFQLFQQFEDKLGEMPESWKAVNDASNATAEALAGSTGALLESMLQASDHAATLAGHLKSATDAQKQFGSATHQSESGLKKMAKEAKELGENIFGIGKFLFKMGAIGVGAVGAGLFGIDKLADSAVANQRSARQLGLTTGQYRAFDTDLGRDVGSNTLTNVVDARHSLSGQVFLERATGLSQQQLASMDSGSVAAVLSMRENAAIKANPNWSMQSMAALGFTQLGESQSDLMLHGAVPAAELQKGFGQYQSDSGSLNYGNDTVEGLYDFSNRLKIAGQHVETYFSDKLSELNRNGALSHFVTSLEKDAEILLNGIFTPKNLKGIEKGLTKFASLLASPEFISNTKAIADGMASLAKAIAETLHLIAPDGTPKTTDANGKLIPLGSLVPSNLKPGDVDTHSTGMDYWKNPDNSDPQSKLWHEGNYSFKETLGGLLSVPDKYMGPYFEQMNPNTELGKKHAAILAALGKDYGLPSGMLLAQETVESAGNLHAVSPKGARGPFQLMPETAKQYGVTNSFDWYQSAVAAARLDADNMKRAKGDIHKTLGSYNWGSGNMANAGDNWEANAPKETKDYINRVIAVMAKNNATKQAVNITITNKAGANVAVATNAAGI
jgi:hypothetical protein